MGKYLTDKERYLIEHLYNKQHLTQREIAKQLGKHYNTMRLKEVLSNFLTAT